MQDMIDIKGLVYVFAAMTASAIKFLMGRIVAKFYGKWEDLHKKESWMVAGVLVLNLLSGLGIYQLE